MARHIFELKPCRLPRLPSISATHLVTFHGRKANEWTVPLKQRGSTGGPRPHPQQLPLKAFSWVNDPHQWCNALARLPRDISRFRTVQLLSGFAQPLEGLYIPYVLVAQGINLWHPHWGEHR